MTLKASPLKDDIRVGNFSYSIVCPLRGGAL